MKRNMKVSVKCSNDRCYCCIPTISATVEYTQNGPEANGVVHSNYHQKKDRATTNCLKLLRRLMSLLLFMICISMITMISTFALRFSGGIHRFPVEFPEPTLIAEHREKILILSTRIGNPLRFEGSDQQKAELYRDLSGNKRLYAAHWDNVEYLERNKAMVAGPEQWTKPFFIRSIMRNESYGHFDWILWMDADTAILNCSVSVLDLIEHRAVTASKLTVSNDSNIRTTNGDWTLSKNGCFSRNRAPIPGPRKSEGGRTRIFSSRSFSDGTRTAKRMRKRWWPRWRKDGGSKWEIPRASPKHSGRCRARSDSAWL